MDVVDAQVHVGRGMTAATLEAMDALCITSLLIDECWNFTPTGPHPTHIQPGFPAANGAWRALWPTADEACLLHPDRFSSVVRIDPRDPQLEHLMRVAGSSPHVRAFRIQPAWTMAEARDFADGSYDQLLEIAQDIGLPVALFVPGFVELLPRYLRKFPGLTFVVDHCGMGFPNIPADRPAEEAARTLTPGYLDEVEKLAEFPNVAVKWSHAQNRFDAGDFPYPALRPLLRRMIGAFGADRIIWASDKTVMFGYNWSDLLHCLRDDPELSDEEKQWILGGSARRIFDWPATETPRRRGSKEC